MTYSYTSSGSPCSGDPSLPCSRTDGRSITTTYSYDGLNRLTSKTYSDSTPSVTYYYDQPSYNGLTIANGKGRRTGMSDGTGQTAWSYDAAGNVLTKRQTIAGVTNNILYTYNLNSSVATMTTPNGHTYTYGYSNAFRAVSLVDNGNGYTYVQNAHYAAPGLLTSAQHGLNLAITETNYFNNRLEPTVLSATGGQTVLNLGYNWVLPGNVNNGNVYQIQNNRDSSNNRSFQYSYDALNRLQTAGTMAGASSPWTTTYSYDNWGNLVQKSTTGSGGDPNMGPLTVDAHNHVNPGSYPYDGAGNLTFDGVNYLKFDAENRINPVTGYVYSYDGENHRVEKNNAGSITYYWYDDNFNVISTTGNISRDYVYFNGQRIAFYSATSGNQHYYWSDHLGSARTMSNSSGSTIEWEGDYYPFGNKNVLNNNVDNYFLFTGYEFDYELGDNYANNREQLPVLGKFLSPDPVPGDPADPQSLNRYAYVNNNPLNAVDPLGLKCVTLDNGVVGDDGTQPPCGSDMTPGNGQPDATVQGSNESSFYYWLMYFANYFYDPPKIDWGGSSSGGGTPAAPSKPAANNGTQKPQPQKPKPCSGAKGGTPLAYSVTGIFDALVGVGPALSISWVPGKHELFIAPGVGGTVGHNFSGGPLIGPNPSAVLPGWGLSAGYNVTPLTGVQATGNSSGTLAGNSFGVPGASIALTYGFCISF